MTKLIDSDDVDCNTSHNEHFETVLAARLSRRSLLRGGFASAAGVVLGSVGLAGCGSSDSTPAPVSVPPAEKLLAFSAVSKSLADVVSVPVGYSVSVLYALGDPLTASTGAYLNDGTDADFENRSGDHHDGMEFYGLSNAGAPAAAGAERGLLAINHEATTDERLASHFLHANGGTTTLPRPASEVDKEVAIHGVAVIEVAKSGAAWSYVKASAFNRRVTPLTDIELSGPARGNALLVTKYSATGTKTRGTLNNCGTGKSPWGSFLTGEENWSGYFVRGAADDTARSGDKSIASLKRYGRNQGATSRHGWETGGVADKYARWDISRKGASLDGSDDYRNEMNG
ncbi:MAG: alkaline phosphatase PhoX, partial [Telluria sp.]